MSRFQIVCPNRQRLVSAGWECLEGLNFIEFGNALVRLHVHEDTTGSQDAMYSGCPHGSLYPRAEEVFGELLQSAADVVEAYAPKIGSEPGPAVVDSGATLPLKTESG